jgi:dUTP pyrophosphatase
MDSMLTMLKPGERVEFFSPAPQLKVKRLHPDAVLPKYATEGAACFDLAAVGVHGLTMAETEFLHRRGYWDDGVAIIGGRQHDNSYTFRTGLAFEVPPGWVMLIYSRSGHGFKNDVRLSNCVGVIDSDYRGEVSVKLRCDGAANMRIQGGDRIAQAMLVQVPQVQLVEVDELTDTARGAGGFGSTGA